MFMSVVERSFDFHIYPELAGARVLILGLTCSLGVDVARSFAEHKARIAIVSPDDSPAMVEVASLLVEAAQEVQVFSTKSVDADEVVRLVQRTAADFGGFDVVINLASFDASDVFAVDCGSDVEDVVASKLTTVMRATHVAANRMRLTRTEGAIVNIVTIDEQAGDRAVLLADAVRAMLGELTRGQAREWAEAGIRINSIGPQSSVSALLGGATVPTDADFAASALYLASRKGRKLSGHLLDAESCGG